MVNYGRLLLPFCLPITSAAFAQPANDEPCGAVQLMMNDTCAVVSGSTVEATATLVPPVAPCGADSIGDIWYSFNAPTGVVNITMFTPPLSYGRMGLFSADSCGAEFQLVACASSTGGAAWIQRSDLHPDATYWLSVQNATIDGDPGAFSICATGPLSFPSGDCLYSLEMFDNIGDDWQGATVTATVNGVPGMAYTCDASYSAHLIGLNAGDTLALSYSPGTNESGNRYRLRYGTSGPAIFNAEYPLAEGPVFELVNACTLANVPPVDCDYRVPVCADTAFIGGSFTGVTYDLYGNGGCLSDERSGTWVELLIAQSGALGFMITPAGQEDIDFALWGPYDDVVCPPPSDPIRCSFAIPIEQPATGLLASETDSAYDLNDNGYVDTVHVFTGERYVLYIDNFSWNGASYGLTFQLTEGAMLACADLPEAAFGVSDNSVVVGEPVSFVDQSSGAPYAWAWAFPGADQVVSVIQNPGGITYSLPGCYDVSLTTTNIAGTDATTHVCEVEVSVSSSVNRTDLSATSAHMANDRLVIDRPGRNGAFDVVLLDASGRTVIRSTARGNHMIREIPGLSVGCYTLLISDGPDALRMRLPVTR